MFTPALKLLKDAYPDSQIDALVMLKGVEDIYSRLEEINKIHYHDYLKSSKSASLFFTLGLRNKYDLSINVYPANRKEYNLISFLVGAKKRAAVKYLRNGGTNFSFLNNVLVNEDDSLHNVQENLHMAELLTGRKGSEKLPLNFPLRIEESSFAEELLKKYSITENDLVIGFHPGCATLKNHIKRRWEPAKFGELGKLLIREQKAKILIFGGPDELELKETVSYKINDNSAYTINTSSLAETAAVMKRCDLFVTNDSSLMHVASSLRLNTIALIGPTNINYIHPWQTNYEIVSLNLSCAPCFHYSPKPLTCSRTDIQFKCIKQLEVNLVYEKAKGFIRKRYLS